MAESHEKNLPRRDFLKSAAAAAFVGTCLETDFREAIAAAKQAGKPMLTEKGINDFIASKSKEQLRPLMEEARHDLRAFVRKHFYVAPQQEKELTALDEADIRKLNDALGTALKQNLKPQAKFVTAKAPPPASAKTEAHAKAAPGGGGGTHITVSILGHEVLNITVERSSKT